MTHRAALALTIVAGIGLAACTNPYDPGQRAVGGGLLGAGGGAALGAIAGGGRGAAIGALAGGALGAAGGAVTTPTAPQPQPYYNQQPAYPPSAGYERGYQPGYEQSGYAPQPAYQQPGYAQPGYQQPGYGSGYQQGYDPAYAQPQQGYYRGY